MNHSILFLCQAVIMLLSAALEFHTRLVADKGTSARVQDEILASIVQGVDLHCSVLTTVLTDASESWLFSLWLYYFTTGNFPVRVWWALSILPSRNFPCCCLCLLCTSEKGSYFIFPVTSLFSWRLQLDSPFHSLFQDEHNWFLHPFLAPCAPDSGPSSSVLQS